jgi:hypothetical protein
LYEAALRANRDSSHAGVWLSHVLALQPFLNPHEENLKIEN